MGAHSRSGTSHLLPGSTFRSFRLWAGRLSASILPPGHPALGEAFCAATQSHVSCTSLDSDTEQMFRRLCGSEQREETQRGSNAGQARILALQPHDNQESGT